ncbi:hypothetical protein BHM03_00056586 [Ensete ventricosum]|nr:hypothetical protein BHM03_00056586 [Ensete ventricosum]
MSGPQRIRHSANDSVSTRNYPGFQNRFRPPARSPLYITRRQGNDDKERRQGGGLQEEGEEGVPPLFHEIASPFVVLE